MNQAYFPPASNIGIVLVVFVVLLISCDLLLVRMFPLSKKVWKRIDYIWLSFAALGLISASAQVRIFVASVELNNCNMRIMSAYDSLHSSITSYAKKPSYLCRTFVRTEFSPPEPEFSNTQNEFNQACAWFQSIAVDLPPHPSIKQDNIHKIQLPNTPFMFRDSSLLQVISELHNQYNRYNEAVMDLEEIKSAQKRSELENILVFLGPWLLAFALALRITKVTGELKYESQQPK